MNHFLIFKTLLLDIIRLLKHKLTYTQKKIKVYKELKTNMR